LARRRLEYQFKDQIKNFFSGIQNGVAPVIHLPELLTPNICSVISDGGNRQLQ
jgi:hypothetical protein